MGPAQLIDQLKAIREPEMRVAALVQALSAGDPGDWVEAFAGIVRRAHTTDDADAAAALEAIAHAAGADRLPYPARQSLYEGVSLGDQASAPFSTVSNDSNNFHPPVLKFTGWKCSQRISGQVERLRFIRSRRFVGVVLLAELFLLSLDFGEEGR